MSRDEIHGDSLLSSISNISVKIDHTQIDDPGFFNQYHHKSIDQHQVDAELDIDVIQDDQDIDHASLVKQLYFRYKAQHNGNENHDHLTTWVGNKQLHGMSEQQDYSQNNLNNQPSQKLQIIHQRKQSLPQQSISPSSEVLKNLRLQQDKRLKNETKNIPKNYGKAIITFIEKYQQKVRQVLEMNGVSYQEFIQQLKQKKKVINTIADLRSMWLDYKYAKCMRLLSNLFLRKYSLSYIFNSRICNYTSHIKYRYRLCDAIKEPFLFKHIKDY